MDVREGPERREMRWLGIDVDFRRGKNRFAQQKDGHYSYSGCGPCVKCSHVLARLTGRQPRRQRRGDHCKGMEGQPLCALKEE